jgi:hypothetical protein
VVSLAAVGTAWGAETVRFTTSPEQVWGRAAADIRTAVEKRRGKTVLSRLAASMKPGDLVQFQTKRPEKDIVIERDGWPGHRLVIPKALFRSPLLDGGRNKGGTGGLHIAGWTDDAHWDSRTGQFLYMGLRQTRRFIAYSEEKNVWRTIELDPKSDNPCAFTRFGHIYSGNGFDHERSRFYHRYNGFHVKKYGLDLKGGISFFDVMKQEWTKLPPKTKGLGGGQAIEYFGAMDGLISLGSTPGFFSTERRNWERMAKSPVSGYHSLIRHNPYRQEVLVAGGNHNPRVVARITKDGKIERLKDAPVILGVASDRLMVDPLSGRYLLWAGSKGKQKKLYEFDSDRNEYRVVESFKYPYGKYAMPVMAFIPEYGVIMWAEGKVFLYKHDASAEYPVVKPEAEQGKGR